MKLKIALRNLYISQAIILLFLAFAYFSWFPYSFSKLGGYYKTAWMLIFVDLVLGPLLVLLIYKENKKYLKFDINVLLGIQLIAFMFGAYSLFLKHPAYAVFTVDRFTLTNVSNIYPQESWFDQFKNHFFKSPKLVLASLPLESKQRNGLIFNILFNGEPDIDSRPKYFQSLEKHRNFIHSKRIPIKQLLRLFNTNNSEMISFTNKYGNKYDDFIFLPLIGNNKKGFIWAFDKRTLKPIAILDIDPWENLKLVEF